MSRADPPSESSSRTYRISVEYLLRCSRWQQSDATFPVESNSHNKRRKRNNDSSGSSSTALRDNTGIGFRLRVFNIFSFSSLLLWPAPKTTRRFSAVAFGCPPPCSPLFVNCFKDTRTMPMEGLLTKMAGRSEMWNSLAKVILSTRNAAVTRARRLNRFSYVKKSESVCFCLRFSFFN